MPALPKRLLLRRKLAEPKVEQPVAPASFDPAGRSTRAWRGQLYAKGEFREVPEEAAYILGIDNECEPVFWRHGRVGYMVGTDRKVMHTPETPEDRVYIRYEEPPVVPQPRPARSDEVLFQDVDGSTTAGQWVPRPFRPSPSPLTSPPPPVEDEQADLPIALPPPAIDPSGVYRDIRYINGNEHVGIPYSAVEINTSFKVSRRVRTPNGGDRRRFISARKELLSSGSVEAVLHAEGNPIRVDDSDIVWVDRRRLNW